MPRNADGQRSTTRQRPSRQTIADGLAHDGIDYLLAQWVTTRFVDVDRPPGPDVR